MAEGKKVEKYGKNAKPENLLEGRNGRPASKSVTPPPPPQVKSSKKKP